MAYSCRLSGTRLQRLRWHEYRLVVASGIRLWFVAHVSMGKYEAAMQRSHLYPYYRVGAAQVPTRARPSRIHKLNNLSAFRCAIFSLSS
jgi:hypothetical protein